MFSLFYLFGINFIFFVISWAYLCINFLRAEFKNIKYLVIFIGFLYLSYTKGDLIFKILIKFCISLDAKNLFLMQI